MLPPISRPISRRALLAAAALGIPRGFAEELKGGIKLTMPAAGLSDDALNFIAYLGVEWVTTSGPGGPTYTKEGQVVRASAAPFEPPWKEADVRNIKDRVEKFGLKVGNLMLHDFRDAILGRPGADKAIENVCESIRVAGKV
ncbi:MAG: hypothetical protein ABJF23_21055, partial [Bryobacteraceae bacterium]